MAATRASALARDHLRSLLSISAAAIVSALALAVYAAFAPFDFTVDAVVLGLFVLLISYSLVYVVITALAYQRADGPTLRRLLAVGRERARATLLLNVSWAALSVVAVGLVLILPGLLDSIVANLLSFGVVVGAWLITVTAYAVHYARLDGEEPSIEFPGTKRDVPVFADYYYLSAQLATTFSSSDVNILTTRARRLVTGQTFISFGFSTFIIALLFSVLFLSN